MKNTTVGIIGFGNMGKAIRSGLLKQKLVSKENLLTSNKQEANNEVISKSQILILTVKPQMIGGVLHEIKRRNLKDKLIISIAAGVEIKSIEKILGKELRIIRVMPNLCAKVNQSISCWIKNDNVNNKDVHVFRKVFQSIGIEIELKKESLLDQITAISGSGPAYFFYLAELLVKSAIEIGLNEKLANELVTQTFFGSSKYLKNSKILPVLLRKKVTSKGGATEAAFEKIIGSEFEIVFLSAVKSAYQKTIELHLKV